MAVKWTEEQQSVIDTRGCNILVSAAAGSGKTAVLVARILSIITDEKKPVDIDRLLVLTFTNAAAAEMRERIRDALEQRAEEAPDNVHLQRQLVLVHNAKITTIHSFCLHVLRNHFQSVGIDPSFRVADEGEILLLEQESVGEIIEEAYVRGDEDFFAFLEAAATGKDDKVIAEMILQLYHFALGQPWPKEWLEECRRMYGVGDAKVDGNGVEALDRAKTEEEVKAVLMQEKSSDHWEMAWGGNAHPAWLRYIEEDTAMLLDDARAKLLEAIRIAGEPDGPYMYVPMLESDLEMIEKIADKGQESYEGYAKAFRSMGSYAVLSRKKDDSVSSEKRELVKEIRSEVKEAIASLRQKYYYDKVEVLQEEFLATGVYVRAVTRLVEAFMERMADKKAEKNILDFGDLEHLALNILVERKLVETGLTADVQEGVEIEAIATARKDTESVLTATVREDAGTVPTATAREEAGPGLKYVESVPTAAALEYAETFEEIMTDEYQDSNLVQELILNSVAGRGKGEHNRFMVGDVKQSIYRFRLARPELFMEKYKAYQGENEDSCRIDLHRNFRSRGQVLEGVNEIFRQIMTENLGGIVYDEDAALYPGADFEAIPDDMLTGNKETVQEQVINPLLDGNERESESVCTGGHVSNGVAAFLNTPSLHATELWLLETDTQSKQKSEAILVGRRIQKLVGHMPVWDKTENGYRPAKYSDIVILLRTVSGWAEAFGETLGDMGIPCFTGSQKGYFSTTEIRTILSYLQILDNPIQDIPFAAVLRSPIGRITDEELAKMRAASEKRHFYDCVQEYRKDGADQALKEKLNYFFWTFERLRAKCGHTPVHLLIWEILDVTGYGEYAAALPGGSQRRANLDMLVEKAIAYEATSYRGLYHFVRYIENLKKYEMDYGEANVGLEAADTVRIMSIHKSKGLEFPIVFVSGMGKQFNESDSRSKIVAHPEFGIGCDFVDTKLRTRQATLLKKVIQKKTIVENLGEELRVLYVAMTRAKEKLIMTGGIGDLEAAMGKWESAAETLGDTLSYSWLSSASTYLDWTVPGILRCKCSKICAGEKTDRVPLADSKRHKICVGEEAASGDSDGKVLLELHQVEANTLKLEQMQEQTMEAIRLAELLNYDPSICRDPQTRSYLEQVFASEYPFEAHREIIAKLSVSELKKRSHMPEETEALELYQPEIVVPLIPQFCERQEQMGGAARGTVYHAFMENLDFSKKDGLEIQLEELISCGKMSREESRVLRLSDIRKFLASGCGKRMAAASERGQLYREHPFVLGVPADEIRPEWSHEETVLVQGIIDACFREEDDTISILDYKTDHVSHPQELVERYRAQLDYYALALERLTGCRVKDRIIYSFHFGKEILIPPK